MPRSSSFFFLHSRTNSPSIYFSLFFFFPSCKTNSPRKCNGWRDLCFIYIYIFIHGAIFLYVLVHVLYMVYVDMDIFVTRISLYSYSDSGVDQLISRAEYRIVNQKLDSLSIACCFLYSIERCSSHVAGSKASDLSRNIHRSNQQQFTIISLGRRILCFYFDRAPPSLLSFVEAASGSFFPPSIFLVPVTPLPKKNQLSPTSSLCTTYHQHLPPRISSTPAHADPLLGSINPFIPRAHSSHSSSSPNMCIPANRLIKTESRGLKWKRKSFVRLLDFGRERIEL